MRSPIIGAVLLLGGTHNSLPGAKKQFKCPTKLPTQIAHEIVLLEPWIYSTVQLNALAQRQKAIKAKVALRNNAW